MADYERLAVPTPSGLWSFHLSNEFLKAESHDPISQEADYLVTDVGFSSRERLIIRRGRESLVPGLGLCSVDGSG